MMGAGRPAPFHDLRKNPRMPYKPVTPAIVEELQAIVGAEYLIYGEPARMDDYAHDETVGSAGVRYMPELVVRPGSAREIGAIMRLANREHVPVTPRGAGSGMSGGAVPICGGILLSLERLNRVLEIDLANLVAVVEPGVITNAISEAARAHGLFYAGYPMSVEMCSIGGNVAENAGGGRAIKYGVTGRYVLGLEVVLPTGEILDLGGKRLKDVAGYDLVHLLVGSEGTLGIFTRIILRLLPMPAVRVAILVPFTNVRAAIEAVPRVILQGRLVPSAIEFMDCIAVQRAYEYAGERPPLPGIGAMLLFEVDGSSETEVESQYNAVIDLCLAAGALDAYLGNTPSSFKKMWRLRERLSEGLTSAYPVQSAEDIVVPPARIPDLLAQMDDYRAAHQVEVVAFGHAGDGNLHLRIVRQAGMTPADWQAGARGRSEDLYRRVAQLGGTISAEHGIGSKLVSFLPLVQDAAHIALQKRIKEAFDPLGILNPGKILSLDAEMQSPCPGAWSVRVSH